jgi:hypothetical protein
MKPNVPVLSKKNYEVRPAPLRVAQELVQKYHYSKGGSNTGTYVHGLYSKENPLECLGVAWWIPPTKGCAINSYPDGDWTKVLSLSRLVIHPDVPQNGASFLMGKSIQMIRQDRRFECLVTYGDTWRGHSGAIYKATNWEYLGLTKPTAVWVDSSERMVAQKAGPKTRTVEEMRNLGFKFLGRFPKHKYRIILSRGKRKDEQTKTMNQDSGTLTTTTLAAHNKNTHAGNVSEEFYANDAILLWETLKIMLRCF